jgi:hypothetical protein
MTRSGALLRDFGASQNDNIREARSCLPWRQQGPGKDVESLAPRFAIREQNRDPNGVAPVGAYYNKDQTRHSPLVLKNRVAICLEGEQRLSESRP